MDDGFRGRVLLVEDEPDVRSYVARLLRRSGWSVTECEDAESADEHLESHDLLLCDVMLPGMDGIEFVRMVRARPDAARWLSVILLTARVASDDVVAGLTAGADDYVTKPFEEKELLARVGTHTELALMRRVVLQEAEERADNLERALASNRTIGTAMGIIMAHERVTSEQAFDRLRQCSQGANRKLRDVAEDVIFAGVLPDS
jgi:DNA-binding response OmpR family regulator